MDGEIEVPSYFLCPISLEIMKDPVTVVTGITYDRESIEKWMFSGKTRNETCPVTKQSLSGCSDLTPNHTLRRLIQAWCTLNAALGVERIPTPKPPVSQSQISKLLADAARSPNSRTKCLKQLRSIAAESETNRRCLESSGIVAEFLASLILSSNSSGDVDEAISVLQSIKLSDAAVKSMISRRESEFVVSLVKIMRNSASMDSRIYAVMMLKSVFEVSEPQTMTSSSARSSELFAELVNVIRDNAAPPQAAKAALQVMIRVMPWGRNRVKAVEAGAVAAIVESLLESTERRRSEMLLAALEVAAGCAEGRAELVGHAAGLAVVSKKVLRVSNLASEKAVRVILSVAKYSATPAVIAEMASLGVVTKMCLVLQVDCGAKTKEKAREVLRIHARTWKNSTCVPMHLMSSYPK